jgi:hypothetical protein
LLTKLVVTPPSGSPLGTTTTTTTTNFDNLQRATSIVDGKAQTKTIGYDPIDRVKTETVGSLSVSHTVYMVLRRHRVARLWERDRSTGQVVGYQRQRPGELLHVDVHKQGRIPDGGGHRLLGRPGGHRDRRAGVGYDFLHIAVDDCSRVASAEALDDERGVTVAGFTARALAFYTGLGVVVERVLTDNGIGYRSHAFKDVLATAGVVHKRTRPYRPQTNGKVDGSTAPCTWNGPTPPSTAPTRPAWTRCRNGCTTTTTTGPTPPCRKDPHGPTQQRPWELHLAVVVFEVGLPKSQQGEARESRRSAAHGRSCNGCGDGAALRGPGRPGWLTGRDPYCSLAG